MNNTRMARVLLSTFVTACFAFPASADSVWGEFDTLDPESVPLTGEPEDTFAGRIQFGYMSASGNSETTNLNGKTLLGWDFPKWRHAVAASGIYSEEADTTIAENYRASYKADRKLDGQNYLFGTVSWEQDEFSGYEERTTEAVGYGRRILETGKHTLDAEIGAGARQTEFVDGTEQDETIARLAANYLWQFAENSDFSQQLAIEAGDLNTYVESVSSLTAQLIGELDLVVSYTVKRNSEVPAGIENVDRYATVSVQYNF